MKLAKTLTKLLSTGIVLATPLAFVVSCGNGDSTSHTENLSNVKSVLGTFKQSNGSYQSLENLNGQGSSSVVPITKEFSILKNFEYESTGSGDGLKVGKALGGGAGIENKDFGMTSSLKHPDNANEWNNVRTVTFAVDAIGIALNLPSGIKIKNDAKPIINIQELGKLYDNEKNTTTTWGKLLENEDTSSQGLKEVPVALGRKGGKSASGTSDGFWHVLKKNLASGSTADLNHDNLAANGGGTTAEANSTALLNLKKTKGSITYLSLGLSLEDEKANKKDGFWIASIKKGAETWNPTLANAKSGNYKWRRPFNVIYNVNSEKDRNFVQFLLQTEVAKIITSKGFIPLSEKQLTSQFGSKALNDVKEDLKKPDTIKITSQTGKTVADAILGLEI